MDFTDRLLVAMKHSGLGYNELGRAVGKKQQGYVSTLIKDRRVPRVATLQAMAGAMKVRFAWLASGDEPMVDVLEASTPSVTPERVVEYVARYPNLRIAAEFARAEGIDAGAIALVEASAQDWPEDVPPSRWLEQIKIEETIRRRQSRGLAQDVDREKSAVERDAARAAEMAKLTKPKLPKRKAR